MMGTRRRTKCPWVQAAQAHLKWLQRAERRRRSLRFLLLALAERRRRLVDSAEHRSPFPEAAVFQVLEESKCFPNCHHGRAVQRVLPKSFLAGARLRCNRTAVRLRFLRRLPLRVVTMVSDLQLPLRTVGFGR